MDRVYIGILAALIVGLIVSQIFRRDFDPFAPLWLFLAGYTQIYVVQALSYREYGLRARGESILNLGALQSLWALLVLLGFYYSGLGKKIAAKLPRTTAHWSPGFVMMATPPMIVWGLFCSVLSLRVGTIGVDDGIYVQFPMLMLVGGVLLLVTGRQPDRPRPAMTAAGIFVCAAYSIIWMFNSKRSHTLFGVLAGVCAFYLPRWRRPSVPIMAATGVICALVVTLAIGWRGTTRYEPSVVGFLQYLGDFEPKSILVNLNMAEREGVDPDSPEGVNKETEEIGGYWLMLATVPEKSPYDYGGSYNRLWSTFVPRIVWADKPLYGRREWVGAWQAGSEYPRDENFTGPAIGVLGAAQLNGGPIATFIVMAGLGLLMRTAYDYYRYHAAIAWAQAWWAMTYFNSWLMTANDDPFVWFYYVYGFTSLPALIAVWIYHRLTAPGEEMIPVSTGVIPT